MKHYVADVKFELTEQMTKISRHLMVNMNFYISQSEIVVSLERA